MMRSRRISLPLVLLWALAHGVWMGAGWHASTQFSAAPVQSVNASAPCSCTWRPATKHVTRLSNVLVSSAHACPVCELGIVAPDVPSTFHVVAILPLPPLRGFARFSNEVSATSAVLPPSRAPPVA